jgi:TDG/mug DNA glycosylase family protein
LHKKGSGIPYGLQTMRPEGFPFTAEETLLFVLTSSSGAAAMSNEAREAPYKELAVLLQQFPWEVPPPRTTTDGGKP